MASRGESPESGEAEQETDNGIEGGGTQGGVVHGGGCGGFSGLTLTLQVDVLDIPPDPSRTSKFTVYVTAVVPELK